jgi:hypothetical protein
MQPLDYSDADTERARQAEGSSAGMATQQLAMPENGGAIAAPRTRPNNAGLVLIGLGVLLLLGRLITVPVDFTGGMVLLIIGSVFYFFGLWKRIYGLIIPASILSGLSVGVTFAGLTNGVSVLWGLALGFMAIYLIGNALFRVRSSWPMIPAMILFGVGLIVAVTSLPSFLAAGLVWAPLLLIAAGLYLGFMRR